MAFAWSETEVDRGSERRVPLTDGSDFVIFVQEDERILTEEQYDLFKQKPAQPGREIDVEISLQIERSREGGARVLGETNLPHGMSLMLSLRHAGSSYFAQDKVEVVKGRIASSWFTKKGQSLPPGTYQIEVSSPLPDLQPPEVKERIGKSGQNLVGSVRTSMGAKMVEYKTDIVVR